LLAVLQNREVKRVGSNKIIPVDIRLVSATNMPLNEMSDKNKPEFRKDLLYRINTVEINVPPLRQRTEDIPLLVNHYLKIYCGKYNKTGIRLEKSQYKNLASYSWPGNVRELQHLIEKAVILAEEKSIPDHIFNLTLHEPIKYEPASQTLDEMEKNVIERSLGTNKGNLSRVAAELGITRATLYRKMEKYGLM
jgi:two-component system, NtrC family, response regulator HydG